jgi:hypothetical protein
MKKVMLVLMLSVFTFSMSSFKNQKLVTNCDTEALNMYNQYLLYTPGAQDAYDFYMYVYMNCLYDGGMSTTAANPN